MGDELGSVIHVIQGEEKGYFDKEESESQERIQSEDRILNRYAYDAFGNRTVCEEKIANRFGYAGEQYDEITQQYYLRARFYNPVIGRFTQEDTYYGDGLNLYEYGRNNPMRYIDPSGHEVRAAAEKNYVNRAVDAMNKAADQGVDGMLERVYGDRGGLKSNGIKGWDEITDILKKEGVDETKINEILNTPKGNRPDPTTYLSKEYIDMHLSNFQDGVTKIKSKAPIDTEGVGLGTFVMSKSVADDVIARAGGDVSKLESLLGLNPGDLGTNPVRVDIPNPQNIRMPSGNEAGAWPGYWTPGGYTKPGGVMEAVVDPVPRSEYIVIENILGR